MRLFFIFILFITFISCKDSSVIRKQLSGSDRLEINFNEPETNNISKTVSTNEAKAINKLIGFVGNKKAEEFKCGYDGNIMFYKKGKLLGDVAFNYSGDGCKHFIQQINGILSSTAMSNEAEDFLKNLAEGKSGY